MALFSAALQRKKITRFHVPHRDQYYHSPQNVVPSIKTDLRDESK
jgi:hypothetical protein